MTNRPISTNIYQETHRRHAADQPGKPHYELACPFWRVSDITLRGYSFPLLQQDNLIGSREAVAEYCAHWPGRDVYK